MKSTHFLFALLAIVVTFTLQSCVKDKCSQTKTYFKYSPVYKKLDQIRQDIRMEGATELENPGNLYYYQNYLFIAEEKKGIHIYDNTDASNPRNIAFIAIPGASNMAVRNNILYADNYIDLLAIDISDPLHAKLSCRVNNVFPNFQLFQDLGYLVDYTKEEITLELSCNDWRYGQSSWWSGGDFFNSSGEVKFASNGSGGIVPTPTSSTPTTGTGGSLARFSAIGDYLYVVNNSDLKIFNVAQCPALSNTLNLGWGIETIFPYQDKLFIGSNSGMFIFDNSNPTNPKQLSVFQHARVCDPVAVQGNTAFVTLRNGTQCAGFINQLDVVDITNLKAPSLIKSYPMHHPIGVSALDKTLYLCDDDAGLKIFNIENLKDLQQTGSVEGITANDVIALSNKNLVLVIGKDGFYQYDNTNKDKLRLLSKIELKTK
jgi:hypothetical protein